MKLYFAGNWPEPAGTRLLHRGGVRNRLLTFAELDGPSRHDFNYWVVGAAPDATERERMWLYFAGSAGGHDIEPQVFRDGARHRLVSYYDLVDGLRPDAAGGARGRAAERFWVGASVAEREELMRLYFAGNVKSKAGETPADLVDHTTGVRHRLLSYADVEDWGEDSFAYWLAGSPPGASVFLDSGAFGAHTRGAVIDIAQYCDYITAHRDRLACYACLDVIGDWRGSRKNFEVMRAKGLDPLPVFHLSRDEPWEVLDGMAVESKYIALGGMASDNPTRVKLEGHLDRCFNRLERHWPVKVHAFGVMAQWALERYPFYSADSASAIVSAGMGRVMQFRDGVLRADGWREYVRRTFDGQVADGVGSEKSAHPGRRMRNVQAILALQRHVTDLWTAKGVTWDASEVAA